MYYQVLLYIYDLRVYILTDTTLKNADYNTEQELTTLTTYRVVRA